MKKIAAVMVASGALAAPGAAIAHTPNHHCKPSDPTCKVYSSDVGSVQDTGASRSNGPSSTPATTPTSATSSPTVSSVDSQNATRSASPTTSSELPFTGIDIVPLVAGGAALLGAGLFVRRFSSDDK